MSLPQSVDVAVIGGGIIGLCIAERLRDAGRDVLIIEKQGIAAGASAANAASFAFSEIVPLASVATLRKSVKWLLDPGSPFSVVARDLPQTAPWLLRFALAARRSRFEHSLRTLGALMRLERDSLAQFLARTNLGSMVRTSGALYLYATGAALERDLANWKLRREQGVDHEILVGSALAALQPGLADDIEAGVHVPEYRMVTEPKDYCVALHRRISEKGVATQFASVERIAPLADRVRLEIGGDAPIEAGCAVIAAGPWSARLAAQLGDRLPLIGERGYNTTFPRDAFAGLRLPLFFVAEGLVMIPLADGVRVGGGSEIAGLERAPDFERSRALVRKARALVPGLRDCEGVEWMGIRPTLPDTLPVIGHSSSTSRVVYAFGHGHLGLTLASSTAGLVADLIAGRQPAIAIDALAPDRF